MPNHFRAMVAEISCFCSAMYGFQRHVVVGRRTAGRTPRLRGRAREPNARKHCVR
jgi:hypothetical protein